MAAETRVVPTDARPPQTVRPARVWFGFLGGAVAWSLRLLVSYPLVPTVCETGWTWLQHAIALLFAWRAAREGRGQADRGEGGLPARRAHFMGVSGVLLNAIFLLAILLEGSSALLHDPCIIPRTDPPRASLGLLMALAAVLGPTPALAHAGGGASSELAFRLDPWVLISLAATAWLYLRGARALRTRRGGGAVVTGRRMAAFWTAMGVLFVALVSPLDALAEALFAAHMVQHLLLMLAAAPLLALASPVVVLLWGLPEATRPALGRWWAGAGWAQATWRALTWPAAVWLLHAVVLWAWHVPRLYEAALASRAVHALEHATFFATALLFWWVLVHADRARGFGHGAGVLYVFAASVQGGALGALLTFASEPWYAVHAAGAAAWGLDPLGDQQLAGLIMWAPASLVYLAAALAAFAAWLRAAERAVERREARAPGLAPSGRLRSAPLLLVLGLGLAAVAGCGRHPEPVRQVPGGDAARGRDTFERYACGACHAIPGVRAARGVVAPPLTDWSQRAFVAGVLPNTPDNLVWWLQAPKEVLERTAMPDLGVTERDARDMAAYLFTLRR
jgi:putative membrane protein